MPFRERIAPLGANDRTPPLPMATSAIPKLDRGDKRGTVSLKAVAYDGSMLDALGVPQEQARSVIMGIASGINNGLAQPNDLPVKELLAFERMMDNPGSGIEYRYRQRIRSPLTGVRAFCVECQGGSVDGVSQCDQLSCPLWALRLGRNAHYGKRS